MLSSFVTQKGQVTIPSKIRRLLQINPGDKVSFKIENNHVVIEQKINDIEAAFGLLKSKMGVSLKGMKKAIRKGATRVRD